MISSEKNPESRTEFYDKLESVVDKINYKNSQIFIGGDFNAKTGSDFDKYRQNMGKYGKGNLNSNGEHLLEFLNRNQLNLTNTLFKHKLAHRATWISSGEFKNNRNNPVRNQIDYLIVKNESKHKIRDSRSYSGIFTDTDHRLVKLEIREEIIKYKTNKCNAKKFDFDKLNNSKIEKEYKENVEKYMKNSDGKDKWKLIKEACSKASEQSLGLLENKTRSSDPNIKSLAEKQKTLRIQIQSLTDKEKRIDLQNKRNKLMNEIHFKVKTERNSIEEKKMTEINDAGNDSVKMFKVIKIINREKPKEHLFIKQNDEMITDETEVTRKISEFFEKTFDSKTMENILKIEPKEMKEDFTEIEVQNAVQKLKNNKSAGPDNIYAEQLKHSPTIVYSKIAQMFNEIAKTGKFPDEISEGFLIPLQKSGKKKGLEENLRPIILLNIIRKILAIIMMNRLSNKLNEHIPATQSAYRAGRSTTENIQAIKLLAEKASISYGYELQLLLLDMSKAFDSVNRDLLLKELTKIIEPDELHILKILITDVKLQVRNGNSIGNKFTTKIGVPQGDCLSPVLFTFYLAKAMEIDNENENKNDHNYSRSNVKEKVEIDMQYADDLSWVNNSKEKIDKTKQEVTTKLVNFNLTINDSKTEQYTINNTNDEWRKCKYLGSLLGTEEDIKHRKQMTMTVFHKMQSKLQSKKISFTIRMKLFRTYITSVFLYNSELWTLTKKLENEIDVFQRNILKKIMKIKYPIIIKNDELYDRTNETPWSKVIIKV